MDAIENQKVAKEENAQEDKRLEERKRLFEVIDSMAKDGVLLQVVKKSAYQN